MGAIKGFVSTGCTLLSIAVALSGCGKVEQNDGQESGQTLAQAKRDKAACASSVAYDRLKSELFDQTIARYSGDRGNLDTLADYSTIRMESPVVEGWDPALSITRCKGRFILDLPPGAERAFAGDRRLQADVRYTAQSAADGSGLVYRLSGAETIVGRLAAFDLASMAFRPPPAIDEQPAETQMAESRTTAGFGAAEAQSAARTVKAPGMIEQDPRGAGSQSRRSAEPTSDRIDPEPGTRASQTFAGEAGERTVRAFYDGLGAGDGAAASARVVPEKRLSGAFSPGAITRFYGKLPEPIRLVDVVSMGDGAYRVKYHYSAGRSRCNGSAIVRVTTRSGRELIRSIRALNGC